MTLTIVLERKERIGALKMFIFKVTDSDGSGGDLVMSPYLSHIYWADVHDIDATNADYIKATWTDGDETITIGNQGGSGDEYKVIVIGS